MVIFSNIIFTIIHILRSLGDTKMALLSHVADPVTSSGNKVTVVGVGQVGMACAFSILTQVSKKQRLLHGPQVPQMSLMYVCMV